MYNHHKWGMFEMSNRMFQNVIAQLKEATDRTIGVIDGDGIVVSSSDPILVGEKLHYL